VLIGAGEPIGIPGGADQQFPNGAAGARRLIPPGSDGSAVLSPEQRRQNRGEIAPWHNKRLSGATASIRARLGSGKNLSKAGGPS
jgi:hypothetical protein